MRAATTKAVSTARSVSSLFAGLARNPALVVVASGWETLIMFDPLYWNYAPSGRVGVLAAANVLVTWALAQELEDTFYIPLDDPAIQYGERPVERSPWRAFEQQLENWRR